MKDTAIQIRVSRETKKHWEAGAQRLGISMSSFCRLMITKGEILANFESKLFSTWCQQALKEGPNAR